MNKRRMLASVVEIVLGVMLGITGYFGMTDEYWAGMGTALVFVGVLQLIRQIRYKTNETYREDMDVARSDERNKYIAMKAWSWAGYFFVLIAAVASIVLKILGMEDYMMIASGSVCLIMVLYWLSFEYLRRKY